ncbi:MAG: hypothetical protein K9M44_01760 [Candidatus Pacebacteria bacterium]|nr:hypothetical protein [Candidatus Paceibacterota bacterium]
MFNNNKSEIEFMPFIYLDSPLIDDLLEKLYNLKIVKRKKDDKYYIFQAKLMIYLAFNKYLHLLFLDIDDDKLIKILEEIEDDQTSENIFIALEKGLEENKDNIINNFVKYFKKNK